MRGRGIKTRLLEEEAGFSVTEMMVTVLIMIIVFFSLHSIFDMSLRVFAYGNNKVEAVENARLGLEKMEREIRAAYPVNIGDPNNAHLFFSANGTATTNPPQAMPTDDQITFGNETGAGGAGDKQITCDSDLTPPPCEYITYKLTDDASNTDCTVAPCTLRRVNTANSADFGDPVVENVVPGGLTFNYYAGDGTIATTEAAIEKVLVSLRITVSPGTKYEATQNLTTEIDLRNR